MNIADYFDTPEQAAEAKQRMLQLGWGWYGPSYADARFVREANPSAWESVRPIKAANGQWEWYNYAVLVRAEGASFSDPVSCAVAWALLT